VRTQEKRAIEMTGGFAEDLAEAGKKIIRKLSHGLRIEMAYINTVVYLTLTRDNTFPSMQEWETVLKRLPFATEKVTPSADQTSPRHTLTARLPITAEQMKFQ